MNQTATAEPRRIRASSTNRKWIERAIVYGVLAIFAVMYLLPLIVMLLTSLKTMPDIRSGTLVSLPSPLTLQPWVEAWSSACVGVECTGLKGFYWNTIVMIVPAVIASTLIGAINGYTLTRVEFPHKKLVFGLILLGSFTPYQAILIPLARTLGAVDLTGNLIGLSLVHTIYGIPFTTAFSRSFYLSLPPELAKAAKVDGAGFFMTFFRIMLPISLPILVVSVIYQFTNVWNDFLFGSALTYGSEAPIMVALNNIVNTSTGEKPYNVHMAAALLSALPTLVIYVLAGKYFVRGLAAGSVKG